MYGVIDNYDFGEMNAMKYYAPPSSWSGQKKRDNAREKIFSGDWLGSPKMDGYFTKLVKDEDGNILLYSRSRSVKGNYVDKHEWVPHLQPFFDSLPNGTCLLCELYFPSAPGSKNVTTIMGCLKEKAVARQERGEKLHLYVFDCLAYDGLAYIYNPAKHRFSNMRTFFLGEDLGEYVSIAKYYSGAELWEMLSRVLAEGGEGMVITHKEALYEPDKRPSKTTLKIKKELAQTIDCFFTGRVSPPTRLYTGKDIENWQYWENERTHEKKLGEFYREYAKGESIVPVTKLHFYDMAGSLQIAVFTQSNGVVASIKGKTYENVAVKPIGWLSGLSDEIKASPSDYAFLPIEVTAMEIDSVTGNLRHAKMVGWRDDLSLEDCTWEKIEG